MSALQAADLPDVIPVFPLSGALLLPRGRLPLHIFEPRYLAMIEDCLKSGHRMIGMIQPRGAPDIAPSVGGSDLQAIGCAGRLTGFSETEDGRYMITLTGVSRFRLRDEATGFTPYRRFNVDWAPFLQDRLSADKDPEFPRDAFLALLGRYFTRMKLATDWKGLQDADAEHLVNSLAMLCPFSPRDKQALLESPRLSDRRETLITLMEFALRNGGEEDMPQ